MPLFDTRSSYRPPKEINTNWDNFRKGLNTLLKETEIGPDELSQADNIVLVGKGVPTKRAGFTKYFLSNSTGAVRGFSGFYKSDGTNELVALTDIGTLTKKSGASYTILTGVSWASGYDASMTQLNDTLYIVNGQRELTKYSSPTLVGFATIGIPTGTFATQISGASGTNSYSYRVSAISSVGETLASSAYVITLRPQDISLSPNNVLWTPVSTASILRGYNIYGRTPGDERFLGSTDASSTTFLDDGTAFPQEFTYPPLADSTGGVKAKYIARFQDRLIYAGISGEPSKVIISGRAPFHERNDIASGGNYVRIEPDAGDDITGLSVFGDKIVVFKERSIWNIVLSQIQVGSFTVTQPNPTLVTMSKGCIAPRSIVNVENDVFFMSRNGVYVLGYEPNIALDVLRTNELSAKIRPFFTNLTTAQKKAAVATYTDFKYQLSFPGSDKTMVYDRERTSWVGPWSFDTRAYGKYYDSSGDEHVLLGQEDGPYIYETSTAYGDDDGTTIATNLRTRREDYGDWTVFKTIKDIYTNWRNVTGTISVDVRLEDREGNTVAAQSFSIQTSAGNSGWGADMFGNTQWGDSESDGGASDLADLVRWLVLNKTGRNMQLIIKTTNRNDNYELLQIRTVAGPIGRGFKGEGWRV